MKKKLKFEFEYLSDERIDFAAGSSTISIKYEHEAGA